MKITEILKRDFVLADLAGKDKESTLKELSAFLQNKGAVKDANALFAALMERERLGSTGIGDGVAVPHAKFIETNQLTALFARSVAGIEFASLDHQPARFVCLLLAPPNSTGLHLKALARISRLFKNPELRGHILNAAGTDQIYDLLVKEDANFI